MLPWNLGDLFSGRSSSRPAVPTGTAAKGKYNSSNDNSSSYSSSNISSSNRCSAPPRGKSGKSLISSALWAVARTPALVEAVERVEAYGGDDPFLSAALRALRPADLSDPGSLRQVAESADAFLQANQRRLSVYDEIQPMEAIRAVLGLCGDSAQVFAETLETTYRSHLQCKDNSCRFKSPGVEVREENLVCTIPKAQLAIELRVSSINKTDVCGKCRTKKAAKRYAVKRAAPCFVATWTALSRGDRGQDALLITTTSGESLRYTLAVVIAIREGKFVCMFSEGNNYFRVEGDSVKITTKHEWQNVQPCLALFTRQAFPSSHASARGIGLVSSDGGGKAGRKRRRQESESEHLGGPSGSSRPGAPAAAEVISIDDDDDDDDDDSDAGDVKAPASNKDASDSPKFISGTSDREKNNERGENGTRTSGSGGKDDVGGESATTDGDGASGPREAAQRSQLVVHGDDEGVDRMDVEGEDSPDAENTATAVVTAEISPARSVSARSTGATTTRATTTKEGVPISKASAAVEARHRGSARDENVSSSAAGSMKTPAGAGDWRDDPNRVRRTTVPGANGSAPDDGWLRQGEGTGGGGYGSSFGVPLGNEPSSSRGKRSRAFGGALDGESQGSSKGLVAAVETDDSNMGDGDGGIDDDDDEVELVTNSQACARRGDKERAGNLTAASSAAAAAAPPPSSKPSRPKTDHHGSSSGWIPRRRPSDSLLAPPPDTAKRANSSFVAVGMSCFGGGDSADSRQKQQDRSSSDSRDLQVHDLVDDDDLSAGSQPPSPWDRTRHPSGVPMSFIGPALPPRPQPDSHWLSRKAKPASRLQIPKKFPPASTAGGSRGAGGAKGLEKLTSMSWGGGKKTALSSGTPVDSGGGGGRRCRGGSGTADDDEEWKPTGKDAAAAGLLGSSRNGGSSTGFGEREASSTSGSSNGRQGLRSGGRDNKMTEDLTGADDFCWQEVGDDGKSAGSGRAGKRAEFRGGWESRLAGGAGMPDDVTLTTIRGINLQQDHFERIVDSDGWLTSQIIDIRVKQLQELYPQHLYFDSSFFGFLCPKTEKGGAFVVDYERVAGWTKRSRLPGGKSSLFDMRKLFIPINQGNIHWVVVVVDMDGGSSGGGGGAKMVVSFFDSFGRDGTAYVEAVQQYLVSELSSRDKHRQGLFTPRPRPPANAPRQHNSSDCGVLMLHVMEQLSCGSVDVLERLTQEEIMSLRLQLVAKIRE